MPSIFMLLLSLLVLGCHAALYVPSVEDVVRSPRLAIQTQAAFRKNDCYPVEVSLLAPDGVSAFTAPQTLAVGLQANAGVFYSSLAGCDEYDPDLEIVQTFLAAGQSSSTVYLRATQAGSLSVSAQVAGYSVESAAQEVPVTFTSFNISRGLNAAVNDVYFDAVRDKWYVGGTFTTFDGNPTPYLVRLNLDGSFDSSFAQSGTGINAAVYATASQSDGKVLVGGSFTNYNGIARNYLVRLNSDGSLDTSFQIGTGFNAAVQAIAVQSDGKILVGGGHTTYNGTSQRYLTRLLSDGTLDSSFTQTGTGLANTVMSLALQPDGKIMVGGLFTTYNGVTATRLLRLNSDGSHDASFAQTGTGLNGYPSALIVQPDGKVLAGGGLTSYNGVTYNSLIRFEANGTPDASFVQTGTGFNSLIYAMALQSDGKVVVAGDLTNYNGVARARIARLNSNGSLDSSFVHTGTGLSATAYGMAMAPSGQILVGGGFQEYNGTPCAYLAQLKSDGSLENAAASLGAALNGSVTSIEVQGDGKATVGGYFTRYANTPAPYLFRFNADGSPDATFVQAGTGIGAAVNDIAYQADGKPIVGGWFTTYNGVSRRYLIRLNANGTLDTSFLQTGTGFDSLITSVTLQPDGKPVVTGYFMNYNATARRFLARLNTDGTLDSSFTLVGTAFNDFPNNVSIQPDGKLLVGGAFVNYNGVAAKYFIRLNSSGTMDSGLNQGTGFNGSVSSHVIQPDGKILVGGSFTTYNGAAAPRLVRLNSDGSADSSFIQTGTGLNSTVSAIALLPDGRILVSGSFTQYNGIARSRVARLNADGSLDLRFDTSTLGVNSTVAALALLPSGKALLGGSFTIMSGATAPSLGRITRSGALD